MTHAELLKELKSNPDVSRLFMKDHLPLVHNEKEDGPLEPFSKAHMRKTTGQLKELMVERLEKMVGPVNAPEPTPAPPAEPAPPADAPEPTPAPAEGAPSGGTRRGGRRKAAAAEGAPEPTPVTEGTPERQPERVPAGVENPMGPLVKALEKKVDGLGKIADEHSDTLARALTGLSECRRDLAIIKAILVEMWFDARIPDKDGALEPRLPFPEHVTETCGREVTGDYAPDDPSVLLLMKKIESSGN